MMQKLRNWAKRNPWLKATGTMLAGLAALVTVFPFFAGMGFSAWMWASSQKVRIVTAELPTGIPDEWWANLDRVSIFIPTGSVESAVVSVRQVQGIDGISVMASPRADPVAGRGVAVTLMFKTPLTPSQLRFPFKIDISQYGIDGMHTSPVPVPRFGDNFDLTPGIRCWAK